MDFSEIGPFSFRYCVPWKDVRMFATLSCRCLVLDTESYHPQTLSNRCTGP